MNTHLPDHAPWGARIRDNQKARELRARAVIAMHAYNFVTADTESERREHFGWLITWLEVVGELPACFEPRYRMTDWDWDAVSLNHNGGNTMVHLDGRIIHTPN